MSESSKYKLNDFESISERLIWKRSATKFLAFWDSVAYLAETFSLMENVSADLSSTHFIITVVTYQRECKGFSLFALWQRIFF